MVEIKKTDYFTQSRNRFRKKFCSIAGFVFLHQDASKIGWV